MADEEPPFGIDRARHEDLTGRGGHVWWRRVVLVLIAAIPVLGLTDLFGQRNQTSGSSNANGTLEISSPNSVRNGLIFTTAVIITPSHHLKDGQLYLDQGWFGNMTLNGVSPQPSNESAKGEWQVWDFGPMDADTPFTIWISWQTNPTNIGVRTQDIALYDGSSQLMTAHHSLTIFP
jgi:hypothetical protein